MSTGVKLETPAAGTRTLTSGGVNFEVTSQSKGEVEAVVARTGDRIYANVNDRVFAMTKDLNKNGIIDAVDSIISRGDPHFTVTEGKKATVDFKSPQLNHSLQGLEIDYAATLASQRFVQATGSAEAGIRQQYSAQQTVLGQALKAINTLQNDANYAGRLSASTRAELEGIMRDWTQDVFPSQVTVQANGSTWGGISSQYQLEQNLLQRAINVIAGMNPIPSPPPAVSCLGTQAINALSQNEGSILSQHANHQSPQLNHSLQGLEIDYAATLASQRFVQATGSAEAGIRQQYSAQQTVLGQALKAINTLQNDANYAGRLSASTRAELEGIMRDWTQDVFPSQVTVQANGSTWGGISSQYQLEQNLLQRAINVINGQIAPGLNCPPRS